MRKLAREFKFDSAPLEKYKDVLIDFYNKDIYYEDRNREYWDAVDYIVKTSKDETIKTIKNIKQLLRKRLNKKPAKKPKKPKPKMVKKPKKAVQVASHTNKIWMARDLDL